MAPRGDRYDDFLSSLRHRNAQRRGVPIADSGAARLRRKVFNRSFGSNHQRENVNDYLSSMTLQGVYRDAYEGQEKNRSFVVFFSDTEIAF